MKRKNTLYKCRTCQELVAMDAKTCPHCGADSPVTAFFIAKIVAVLIFGGLFLLFNKQIQNMLFWVWDKTL